MDSLGNNQIDVVTRALKLPSSEGSSSFNNSANSIITLCHSNFHHTTDQLSRCLDTEALHPRSPSEGCYVYPTDPIERTLQHWCQDGNEDSVCFGSIWVHCGFRSATQKGLSGSEGFGSGSDFEGFDFSFSIVFQNNFIRARIRSTDGTDYRSIKPKPTKSRFCIERPHRASRVLGRGWGCGWSASAHPHPPPHRSTGNHRENHRKSCF